MIITSVRYRKLITGEGYSNQAVEAEAAVLDGDVPEDILLELSSWVKAQLDGSSPVLLDPETLRAEVGFLWRQRDQIKREISTAEAEKQKLLADIARLSPSNPDDDLPF